MLVRLSSTVLSFALITAALGTATTGTAHGYIDVGTGSMLLQILVAGFFGGLLTLKVFWRRVASIFPRIAAKLRARKSPQI